MKAHLHPKKSCKDNLGVLMPTNDRKYMREYMRRKRAERQNKALETIQIRKGRERI